MQAEIEKTIYNVILKVQSYTKDKYLHKIAVKIFSRKNKYVLALKSLLLLQKNYPESEEYISSMEIFNKHFQDTHGKTKENVTTIIKNYLPVIFNKTDFEDLIKKGNEKINGRFNDLKSNAFERCLSMIKDFTYFSYDEKNLAEVEKAVFEALKDDKTNLRKINSDKALFVEVFLSMFSKHFSLSKFKVKRFHILYF